MKKAFIVLMSMIAILFFCILSAYGYTKFKLYRVESRVLENYSCNSNVDSTVLEKYSCISDVESVDAIGHWGEWFSYYSLVVVIDEKKYRVWANDAGEIDEIMEYEE